MTPELRVEIWLVDRVRQHITGIMDGVTDPAIRRDRMRRLLRDNGLDEVIAGSKDGRPETYSEIFRRVYGQPL